MKPLVLAFVLSILGGAEAAQRTAFHVKYVAEGAVYLDGGRASGLAQGMKLTVRRGEATGAELEVISVAETSAVCDIRNSQQPVLAGDTAYLSDADAQTIDIQRSEGAVKQYAQVITFTDGDPLDEEVREYMPHPPLPEVNRVRGRIGFEYNSISNGGAGMRSYQSGLVFRGDMTRIGGTYWNLSGYTRLALTSVPASQQTLTDLINRTYHLTLSYNNPKSSWTAGFGRLYLPWASSLGTIDGGYLGRRFGPHVTAGLFAGTTPDPTSWNYNPDRKMAGAFVNYEGGSYESVHYSATAGIGTSWLLWRPDRQFAFLENSLFFEKRFSIYENLQIEEFPDPLRPGARTTQLARSFVTVRYQPSRIISFDVSHNYFHDLPTFDPRLVGAGLVDQFLFQGVSVGSRVELPFRLTAYTSLGRSKSTGDTKHSLNQMYGVTEANLFGTGVRVDARYSMFDSSFGHGAYKSFSLSRAVREDLRIEVQGGQQNFASQFSSMGRGRFVNGNLEYFFLTRYYLGGGLTVYRSRSQNYNQIYFTLGYRFGK